jgi:hypothetical protein
MQADDIRAAISSLDWLYALIAIVLIVVVLAVQAGSVVYQRRQIRELRKVASQQWNDVMELRRIVESLVQDQAAASASRTRIEAEFDVLTKQQEQLMLLNADAGSYVQAIRQAQRGAGVDELMNTHGLGQAEAELIVALHTRARAEE